MSRKVFISILGTGFYNKCKYVTSDFCSSETRYAQQSILELVGACKWSKNDACYIFTTEKAYKENWDVKERKNNKTKCVEKYTGLEAVLENMGLPFKPEAISIPDGKDEDEMWEIFSMIFSQLEENDELYVDLTHSFRYLPMLLLVLSNYAKFLKNITVNHISYGNFEARNSDTNEAPIVDLLPISALQDWTFAAADYVKNGNTERLSDLSKSMLAPILRSSADENARNMNQLIRVIDAATEDFQTCRGMNIIQAENIRNLNELLKGGEDSFIKPLNPLINKIKESFEPFKSEFSIDNGFYAAQWCFNNGLYQQAATMLQENVVSFFCARYNIQVDDEDKREAINNVITIINRNIEDDRGKWKVKQDNIELVAAILENDSLISNKEITSAFSTLTDLRNDINHFGMRSKTAPLRSDRIKNRLEDLLTYFTDKLLTNKLLNDDYKFSCFDYQPIDKLMFINISNHPYEQWDSDQKEAAAKYGECIDIPFPSVDEKGDEDYIAKLADDYLLKVLKQIGKHNKKGITVHLMGEMTFSVALLERLKRNYIQCVASTSQRQALEIGNGKKESVFKFMKFRKYYEL